MTDFNDVLFKRIDAEPAERPVPEAVAAPTDAEPYALAALEAEVRNVESATEGTRNHTLNIAAFNLGQLVGGGYLPAHLVIQHLTVAALTAGLDRAEILPTIHSGLTDGQKQPRAVAPPQSQPLPQLVALPDPTPQPVTWPVTVAGQPEWTPEAIAALQADVFEQRVSTEMHSQRLRREARKRLDAEEAVNGFRSPPFRPSLTGDLAYFETLPPLTYAIDQLLPTGGNALLTAAFKTGKTTVVNNLARAYADAVPFLGNFEVHPEDGRTVALFNYEVDERQYLRWLKAAGINHTDRVVVLNLRGFRLPLTTPHIEDWVVEWLTARRVGMWVVDPFARALTGCGDENDNSAVSVFLDTLDVIKERAGVRDLVVTAHTGRAQQAEGQERARGAVRLDDWADVRWLLTKDDEGQRYLAANGRDVDVDESGLTHDPETNLLTFEGGDRKWNRRKSEARAVAEVVQADPGSSLSEVQQAVQDTLGIGRVTARRAIDVAVAEGLVRIANGPGNSRVVHPTGGRTL